MAANRRSIAMRSLLQLERRVLHAHHRQTVRQLLCIRQRHAVIRLVLMEARYIVVAALQVSRAVLCVKPVPMTELNAAIRNRVKTRMEIAVV